MPSTVPAATMVRYVTYGRDIVIFDYRAETWAVSYGLGSFGAILKYMHLFAEQLISTFRGQPSTTWKKERRAQPRVPRSMLKWVWLSKAASTVKWGEGAASFLFPLGGKVILSKYRCQDIWNHMLASRFFLAALNALAATSDLWVLRSQLSTENYEPWLADNRLRTKKSDL